MGKVSPRAIGYSFPIARPTDESPPARSPFPKPSLASLRVDIGSKTGPDTDAPSSPISSPISPTIDPGYPRFTSLRPRSSQKQFKRVQSSSRRAGQTENSDEGDLVGDVFRPSDWPIFASEPEYEYLSDNPSFDNGLFDSPLDEQTSQSFDAKNSVSSPVPAALSRLPITGTRKSPSRVIFQSQSDPHAAAQCCASHLRPCITVLTVGLGSDGLAPVLQISHQDFLRETKQRASNWILYSFSNSHCLEDHLTLNDYHIKPHEMVEVRPCAGNCTGGSNSCPRSTAGDDTLHSLVNSTNSRTSIHLFIMGDKKVDKNQERGRARVL